MGLRVETSPQVLFHSAAREALCLMIRVRRFAIAASVTSPISASVSAWIGAGEIVCVVGESGSGKSVTAQAVMGLLPRELAVSAGEARLQGEDVLKASQSGRHGNAARAWP